MEAHVVEVDEQCAVAVLTLEVHLAMTLVVLAQIVHVIETDDVVAALTLEVHFAVAAVVHLVVIVNILHRNQLEE